MNEAEWVACTDPVAMLEAMPGNVCDRKLRLFACACCRQLQNCVDDEAFLDAVETAERFSDGQGTKAALKRARQSVRAVRHRLPTEQGKANMEWVALWLAEVTASENAFGKVAREIKRLASERLLIPNEEPAAEVLFGAFDHLTSLAKALKNAGCDDKDILSHCHSKGPHAKGCWVVDLLLAES